MTFRERADDQALDLARRLSPLRRLAQAAALAAGVAFAGMSGALAQEASPAAMGGECAPVAAPMTAPAASPAASPTDAELAGEPADEALSAAVIATVETYTACFNTGDYEAALGYLTPGYLIDYFGTDDIATIAAAFAATEVPQTVILALDDVLTYPDGRVSVDTQYELGDYQHVTSRMFLVQEGDSFFVDNEIFLPTQAEGDAAIIAFLIADDTAPLAFTQSTSSPEIPVLILYGQNDSPTRHTVVLARLPDGSAGTPIAELPADALASAELVGTAVIEPGERAELVLLELPAGDYLLLDPLVPGSAAPLTITEPVS